VGFADKMIKEAKALGYERIYSSDTYKTISSISHSGKA
jgi:hypothetical protein